MVIEIVCLVIGSLVGYGLCLLTTSKELAKLKHNIDDHGEEIERFRRLLEEVR